MVCLTEFRYLVAYFFLTIGGIIVFCLVVFSIGIAPFYLHAAVPHYTSYLKEDYFHKQATCHILNVSQREEGKFILILKPGLFKFLCTLEIRELSFFYREEAICL